MYVTELDNCQLQLGCVYIFCVNFIKETDEEKGAERVKVNTIRAFFLSVPSPQGGHQLITADIAVYFLDSFIPI